MTDLTNAAPAASQPIPAPKPPAAKPRSAFTVNWNSVGKFAAGFGVAGSVLLLVEQHLVSSDIFIAVIAVPVLSAIGIHQARQAGADIAAKPPATPVAPKPVTPPQA